MTNKPSKAEITAELATLGIELTASQVKNTRVADLHERLFSERAARAPQPAGYSASEKQVEAKVREHAPKDEVKKVRKGTKREELLRALIAGATADEIDALCIKADGKTPWSKSAASAARGVFWRSQMGYGTRIDGDRYFVTLPKNMTIEDVLID